MWVSGGTADAKSPRWSVLSEGRDVAREGRGEF